MDYCTLLTQQLLERCINREERAWHEFVRRYDEHIGRTCARHIRSHGGRPTKDLICEMKSTVYLKFCKDEFHALRVFRCIHEKSIYGYVSTIATRVVHDWYRDSANRIEKEELPADLPSGESMKNLGILRGALECLEAAVGSEPNGERDIAIFLLYYWQGYRAREIAELYGLSVKQVENILLRLIGILRRMMKPK